MLVRNLEGLQAALAGLCEISAAQVSPVIRTVLQIFGSILSFLLSVYLDLSRAWEKLVEPLCFY